MDMESFKPSQMGRIREVSYTLLKNDRKYYFRGVPDYVVHRDGVGADRILVATGEIQSMNRADIQNSIYGVGELFTAGGPILCITIFKNKSATMSIYSQSWGTKQRHFKICCFTLSFDTYY